ncbi:MAG: hypothetical protein ACFB21_06215 [Opitutales bacterium]
MGRTYAIAGTVGFFGFLIVLIGGSYANHDLEAVPEWLALVALAQFVCLILMAFALVGHKVRSTWFFWSCTAASAVCLVFGLRAPLWFIASLCGIAYLMRYRREFFGT